MRNATGASVLMALLVAFTPAISAEPLDLPELAAMYEADQAVRAPENREESMKNGRLIFQQDRNRRVAVLQLISGNRLQTANDYMHAGIILHHTSSFGPHPDGHTDSLGTENHLLAFFLFRQAHYFGHESGRSMMAAAYNYYLKACQEDWDKFGYQFEDGREIWRPNLSEEEQELEKCGFDPRPYFTALDSPPKEGHQ